MKFLFLFLASFAVSSSGYAQSQSSAPPEQRNSDQEVVHKLACGRPAIDSDPAATEVTI